MDSMLAVTHTCMYAEVIIYYYGENIVDEMLAK